MTLSDDTGHNRPDEKTELDGSENSSDDATVAAERAALRKLDWHILPMIFLLYMVSFLDR